MGVHVASLFFVPEDERMGCAFVSYGSFATLTFWLDV